jgi:mannose-6-phosphate isomerase-like protein (cupin superfamily)
LVVLHTPEVIMLKATFDEGEAEVLADGAVRRYPIFTRAQIGANLDAAWVVIAPEGSAGPGRNPNQAALCVVCRGRGQVRVGGTVTAINEFDAFLIPPGAEHGLSNTGDGDLVILAARWKPVRPVLVPPNVVVVEPFSRERLKPAHLNTFFHFEPFSTEVMGAPERFTTGWGLVGGGIASELHKHPTGELYVFFRGATVQQVGLECAAVKAGDSVMVPADTMHNLLNYTAEDVLLYWIEVIPGSLPE